MAPNQYQNDELALILEVETRQRQDAAAREALGQKPYPTPEEPSREPPPEHQGKSR